MEGLLTAFVTQNLVCFCFTDAVLELIVLWVLLCALIQSTLGFETLDIAAALDLETATPLTDPRQYINSNLGFRNLKI